MYTLMTDSHMCWCIFSEVEVLTPGDSLWDIGNYCLTYERSGTTYELYDEQQILYPTNSYAL